MWDSLQNLLPRVAGKYHFKKALDAIEICREYRSLAPRFLPGESLKNAVPQSYRDHTLTVAVKNSSWAQEVQMRKHLFLDALNQKFGENAVKNIKILVSDGPAPDYDGENPAK